MKTELVDLINTTPNQDTIGNHHVLLHKMQYSLEELWDILLERSIKSPKQSQMN